MTRQYYDQRRSGLGDEFLRQMQRLLEFALENPELGTPKGVLARPNRGMIIPCHLLTLWNPSYAKDAVDAHLRVLLRMAERSRDPADPTTADDVYVWWAKVKSSNRDEPLPHAAEIAAIDARAREASRRTCT